MLITETITLNDELFTHNYSDSDFIIRQNETGILYANALDITPCPYTYTETDIPIDPESIPTPDPDPDPDPYAEAGRILMGAE